MKKINLLPAIIYRMFKAKGIDIPHLRTIIILVFLLFFHLVQIALLLKIPSVYIMPWKSDSPKKEQCFFASIYFGVILLIFSFLFSKKKLEEIEVTENQINKCRKILPIYFSVSLALLILLLIFKAK
ncbi:hypothetical protein A8C56_02840 [Niabella ginsenosidivorans]|uniref:Uncharacterized protein n=1 Tax=Niabella ginsenosidivorans TaxID=1176587 RepID=A0A1A9I003_9BACT|nr:hypothetical protein A8C56_02840 [Niabella ginsenosidivorans]